MSEPKMSIESFLQALAEIDRREWEQRREAGQRLRAFLESVPKHLHSHPLVAAMATCIHSNAVMHPDVARRYQERYEELLRTPREDL